MDKSKNYYAILGVLPTAEPIVIRAAYRALAMKYHPDKWTGDQATSERRMREINEAYEILSNDQSRRQYDSVRQKKEYEEYEFDNNTTQDAFRDAEQEQRLDWEVAIDYYPDLEAIYSGLQRTSSKLAFAFRATMLDTKRFSEGLKIARQLEESFLQSSFGRNEKILAFAHKLIHGGHKAAAKELNRAVAVLGHGADADLIVGRINRKFLNTAYGKSTREIAETLLKTEYVSDATMLIEKLGGSIRREKAPGVFGKIELVVTVLGQQYRCKDEYEMAQWAIRTVVPKVLSS